MPIVKPCDKGKKLIAVIQKLEVSKINNGDKIVKKLTENGFIHLICKSNHGYYKNILKHPKYPEYIIKVYRHSDSYKYDSYYVPKDIKEDYLHPIYKTRKILIQNEVKLTRQYKAWRTILDRYKKDIHAKYDVHSNNVGWYRGKPVIFDFCSRW